MPDPSPLVFLVDAPQLVRQQQALSGTFEPAQLARLADYLHSPKGELRYQLTGTSDHRQRPTIRCIITGYLELVCQRCLGPFEYAVQTDSTLVVVASERAMPLPEDEEDDVDFIVAAPKFDLVNLIEDEIILSLPIAPRHAAPNCAAAN